MHSKRNVRADCANGSNPYHECADYCSRKKMNGDGSADGSGMRIARVIAGKHENLAKRGVATVAEARGVDPGCINSSNPYHKCADYCFQRISGSTSSNGVASTLISPRSKEGARAPQRQNVSPKCVNAANPYHRCSEYCLQRIH